MASKIQTTQSQNRNQERERLVIMENISRDEASSLTKEFPNLLMFTNGFTYQQKDDYETDSEEELYVVNEQPVIGSHIFFNGVKYTIIQGIHPLHNSLKIGEEEVIIWIDKNGLLRFDKHQIQERYFYVGPYNPIDYKYDGKKLLTENGNKYNAHEKIDKVTKENLFSDHKNHWDFAKNNTYLNSGSCGNENTLKDTTYNDYYIGGTVAYLLIPESFVNNLFISNTLDFNQETNDSSGKLNNRFKPKLRLLKQSIILDDDCKYNLYTTEDSNISSNDQIKYNKIRIYNASNASVNIITNINTYNE